MCEGKLVLVVGPSGTGKDTLLDGARCRLRDDKQFVFVRRTITRPATAGGEDHHEATEAEFDGMASRGAFAFHWRAHGLSYGIPSSIQDELAAGRIVILNGSRATLTDLRQRFSNLWLVLITTPPAVLRQRLFQRGRESAAEIDRRLARLTSYEVSGPNLIELVNASTIEAGVERMVATLRSFCGPELANCDMCTTPIRANMDSGSSSEDG